MSDAFHRIAPGVFQAGTGPVVQVRGADLAELRKSAAESDRKRARLCAHRENGDAVHEMLILMRADSFVRPHRHPAKVESFHVIDGKLDVVLFDDAGELTDIIEMGPHGSDAVFFYRLSEPLYHTVVLRTPEALIHETTNGPFDPADAEFAPWAPEESDLEGVASFSKRLEEQVITFKERAIGADRFQD